MDNIEVYGKTVEDAVKSGAEQLGVSVDEVDYVVLEEAQKGGLFKKPVPAKVSVSKKLKDSQRAVKFLEGLFEKVNVSVDTEITTDIEDKICINLISTNSSFLIGYRGEVLDALQCLAGAVANIGREDYKRVVVDCENYRKKREDILVELANKLAAKSVRTGRKINLEPMNPFERRIIHTTLADNPDVKTESEGKEPNRYLVIVPNELKDNRPLLAERSKNAGTKPMRFGKKPAKKSVPRGTYKGNGGKYNRDSKGGYKGGYKGNYKGGNNKRGTTTIYGKPKDKGNISSFGTFIGNSHKED